jgi:outer membrane protein with beta-barrel domain
MYYDTPPMPPPLEPRRRFRWGAEFRLEGAPMGSGAASNAGMGGFGLSLRPRPSQSFAVDIGADFFGGRDYNGERRGEQSLTIDPMIFVNPRSRVTFYLFAGFGLSSARVEHANGSLSRYSYIGVNAGPGFEFHFWRRIAIDADVMFFLRDHTDNDAARYPEFVDPATGRYTNTSKGAIIRVGLAYYW